MVNVCNYSPFRSNFKFVEKEKSDSDSSGEYSGCDRLATSFSANSRTLSMFVSILLVVGRPLRWLSSTLSRLSLNLFNHALRRQSSRSRFHRCSLVSALHEFLLLIYPISERISNWFFASWHATKPPRRQKTVINLLRFTGALNDALLLTEDYWTQRKRSLIIRMFSFSILWVIHPTHRPVLVVKGHCLMHYKIGFLAVVPNGKFWI